MNKFYQIINLLLIISLSACVSSQPLSTAANDEDKDIGLGGTGMLANTDGGSSSGIDGNGLGGTGIIGEITGFGSIFVNGIEIEYDDKTNFTIDEKTAELQSLMVGDVVEVLTTDSKQHTHAQTINLRHEVIGVVESVDKQTYSYTVNGQSIIQPIDKSTFPEIGATVAVSGFRIDEQTVLSSRVTPATPGKFLLRTTSDLPFSNKTQRWLIQSYVRDDNVTFDLNGEGNSLSLKKTAGKADKGHWGTKILRLQKNDTEKLEIEQVIETVTIPRGRPIENPVKQRNGYMINRTSPGSAVKTGVDSGASQMINSNQTKTKNQGGR